MATPFDGKSMGDAHAGTCLAFPPGALSAPLSRLSRYAPGSVLSGKYRLDSLIGEGGMGAVWRASNLLLDLPVAIKLIRADLDHDALRARLQLEARSVAKLGHPAIVRIYDVGESELGDPFIVMELLSGETLAQVVSRGRLSAVRAVQLLLPIIDALSVAHARGIVHRDLKPDNLLIALEDQRTQPKILDFGIAKLTDPRDTHHRLTEVGTVVGSPDYMSPEQARGRDNVDHRADIWSLCVVLYEAITGCVPFSASNYNALLRAIVEDEPRTLDAYAAGDPVLWEILRKGLAKDRFERHRSMAELGRALATWLLGHGVLQDACGTSVESKWFGRASDPLGLDAPLFEGPRPINSDSNPKLGHDSRVAGNGVDSRAPFTATVRPKSGERAGTLRAAALACALVGGLALAFAFAPDAESVRRHSKVSAARSESDGSPHAPTHSTSVSAPPVSVAIVTRTSTPEQTTRSPMPEQTPAQSKATIANTHAKSAVQGSPARTAIGSTGVATTSASQSAVVVPTKPSARDLGLLSPY